MKKYQQFIFSKYILEKEKNQIKFCYSLDNKINFVETLKLDLSLINFGKINLELLDSVLFNLHLVIGISYWKTYCPKEIIIETGQLNKKQAGYWNKVYTKGLGEFYYRNKIDWRGLVNFPFEKTKAIAYPNEFKDRSLVPIGGGKDSLVTIELLRKNEFDFSLFSLGDSKIQKDTTRVSGSKRILIGRKLDKKILDDSLIGAYKGHVPVSLIYSFSAILACVLYDYKYVVFSNEHSANFGNAEYLGMNINHQYSKTLESEKDLSQYLHDFISPSLECFSLLRQLSELKIAEMFSEHKKYFSTFSSCNRNFTVNKSSNKRWCGACAKCAFVFSQLAPYISRETLLKIFGKNLFADIKLLDLYKELLGEKNIKPFDCVGTSDEVKLAMFLILKNKEFNDDVIMKYFIENVFSQVKKYKQLEKAVMKKVKNHNIPQQFLKLL